jgi:glycosyltransferase involved in cell wall biosynthesis
MANVALCAIMKNEYRYILEWVAYHRLLNFNQIIVYSNDSTDGSVDLLDVLAQNGIVTHRTQRTGGDVSPQNAAYADALAKSQTDWLCFLDADEFLVLKKDATVAEFVDGFDESVSAIAVHWRVFGSSGRRVFNSDPVIERFTMATDKDHSLNTHFKSLVRPRHVEWMAAHQARLRSGNYVDSAGAPIERENLGRCRPVATERAQVNHYCVKSREEFEWKKKRGTADRVLNDPLKYTSRDAANFFDFHDRNENEDLRRFNCRDRVKQEMRALSGLLHKSGLLQFS